MYNVIWQAMETEQPEAIEFREFLLAALDESGDQTPGGALATLIVSAPTAALRRDALNLLSEASQELSFAPFKAALDDPDPAVRESALAYFDELNVNQLMAAVTDAVLDRDDSVRLLAFSTLEEMHEFAPIWEVAERVVHDPDPLIRKRALEILTYGDRDLAIDYLTPALDDPSPRVSERAADLLTELEGSSS